MWLSWVKDILTVNLKAVLNERLRHLLVHQTHCGFDTGNFNSTPFLDSNVGAKKGKNIVN